MPNSELECWSFWVKFHDPECEEVHQVNMPDDVYECDDLDTVIEVIRQGYHARSRDND